MKKIILASTSPRRRDILSSLQIRFDIIAPNVDETYPDDMDIADVPLYLAEKKAQDVLSRVDDAIVIAADTVVVKENQIFGKPKDFNQAFWMIKSLQGSEHWVYTGLFAGDKRRSFSHLEKTRLIFRSLSDEQIRSFLQKEYFKDKAGGYGVHSWGKLLLKKVEGDFYNIVGLPVVPLVDILENFGIKIL